MRNRIKSSKVSGQDVTLLVENTDLESAVQLRQAAKNSLTSLSIVGDQRCTLSRGRVQAAPGQQEAQAVKILRTHLFSRYKKVVG